ncbi:MAG: endolytic transglycosylase MltG [Solirubrobacterales bacterium]
MSIGNRTAEERERAREERELRRAGTGSPEAPAIEASVPPAEPPSAEKPQSASVPPVERPPAVQPPSASAPLRVSALPRAPAPRRRDRRPRWPALALAALAVVAVGAFALAKALPSSKPVPAPAPLEIVKITIPEGETRAQIARIAAAKGLTGSYLASSRHSPPLDPAHYGAPRGTPSLEGFLFPATYELFAGSPARRLVAEQLTAFEENFGRAEVRRARALHITPYQLLTVASMVEREALLERDRPRVAAVIYNRLRAGMPLGIDATIRYALHDFSAPLTEAQLHSDSPYNTRTHRGLPPTPISNPGMASIEAAAHPAHVPYLYYVNGADGCGDLVFSETSAAFERNAAAYQAALSRNGGRVPTCRRH